MGAWSVLVALLNNKSKFSVITWAKRLSKAKVMQIVQPAAHMDVTELGRMYGASTIIIVAPRPIAPLVAINGVVSKASHCGVG